jgi:FkbM family methyltransferase
MQEIEKMLMKFLQNIFGDWEFEMKFGLAKGLKRRFGMGFKPRFSLSKEEKFLTNLNFNGKTIVDVGAYIGMYSLFFARAAGRKGKVFSFEPNPKNYEELVFNLELNALKNVKAYNLALGRDKSEMKLVVPAYSSRGSLNSEVQRKLLKTENCGCFDVKVESLDNLIKNGLVLKPDFIKIDVEGFEAEVLEGMSETIAEYKPELLIELHEPLKRKVVDMLLVNYLIYDIESKMLLSQPKNLLAKGKGHIYCKFPN